MIRFILVTFLFLAWGFYELSGGSEFEPEVIAAAEADTAPLSAQADGIDIVTRGVDPTLASLAVPERLTQPLITPETAAASEAIDAVLEEVSADVADVPSADIIAGTGNVLREVAGTRVNMRTGPGTDYGVVTTLDAGTRGEVVETDPSGWVKLRVTDSGLEGWMAERLLAPVNG